MFTYIIIKSDKIYPFNGFYSICAFRIIFLPFSQKLDFPYKSLNNLKNT